jgi:regulator of sirC expression with transglutaminase-like and TPR domain
MGFAGNANNYYDPDNSYLHVMLRTRRGIPISLALLWLELAGQIGLEAYGVGFPGHFLVKVHLHYPQEGKVVIDPFNGHSLTKEDLTERLSPLYAESGLARDGEISDELLKHYLRSASPREIMTRMLRNLEEVYGSQDDAERLDAVRKRLKVLLPSLDETD